jgi:hypothetical protein
LAHYEILEILGRRGIGIVLRGVDVRLNRVVAIKSFMVMEHVSGPSPQQRIVDKSVTVDKLHWLRCFPRSVPFTRWNGSRVQGLAFLLPEPGEHIFSQMNPGNVLFAHRDHSPPGLACPLAINPRATVFLA